MHSAGSSVLATDKPPSSWHADRRPLAEAPYPLSHAPMRQGSGALLRTGPQLISHAVQSLRSVPLRTNSRTCSSVAAYAAYQSFAPHQSQDVASIGWVERRKELRRQEEKQREKRGPDFNIGNCPSAGGHLSSPPFATRSSSSSSSSSSDGSSRSSSVSSSSYARPAQNGSSDYSLQRQPPVSGSTNGVAVFSAQKVPAPQLEQKRAASALAEEEEEEEEAASSGPAEDENGEPLHTKPVNPEVCVVKDLDAARRVARLLLARYRDRVFACDTEVADIDVKKETPCGHGEVICFSLFCGDDADFGAALALREGGAAAAAAAPGPPSSSNGSHPPSANGARPPSPSSADHVLQNQLWVDARPDGDSEAGQQILEAFRAFFEADDVKKVWHNYSFDRHVLSNRLGPRSAAGGAGPKGFHADTMHMARLWDSSLKSYSLESLTGNEELMGRGEASANKKTSMKKIFGRPNRRKDGSEGKLVKLAPVEELQEDPTTRGAFINYAAQDARATYKLYEALRARLASPEHPCIMDGHVAAALGYGAVAGAQGRQHIDRQLVRTARTMWDVYEAFWRPFGLLLTDMEHEGILVDREHLAAAQKQADADQERARKRFQEWATARVPAAKHMNVGSGLQVRQLVFSGAANEDPTKGRLEDSRKFKVPNPELLAWLTDDEGKEGKEGKKGKKPKKDIEIELYSLWGKGAEAPIKPQVFTPSGWPALSTPVLRSFAGKPGAAKAELKKLDGEEETLDDKQAAGIMTDAEGEEDLTAVPAEIEALALEQAQKRGDPGARLEPTQQQKDELQGLADKKVLGSFYAAFGGGREGLEACRAVDSLCEVGAIDTLLSNFIEPLQGDAIATRGPGGELGRVHCSLNINTETGRLSARRPNLQNQPALEKDRYKVRKAFRAAEGNTLVVADYGQLELRLLAHITECASMLRAFEAGGDFHSRTALGMYDHIQEAIRKGECVLERDEHALPKDENVKPPPLLKDLFGSERRKAKVLNFSIAYGKTAHGLARDWGTSLEEAETTVQRWYADRPEVKRWQETQRRAAKEEGGVRTLLGRVRRLPDAAKTGRGQGKAAGHALRAAINTPIQGSAADVAAAAMIKIQHDEELERLGFKLLLQVHDEVILEGPKGNAQEALERVVLCMQRPFGEAAQPLRVELAVDANTADTWYEAK